MDTMTHTFTPGPWSLAWEDGKHGVVGSTTEGKLICIVGNNGDGKNDERRANATLMAAAPDLLVACEVALQGLNPSDWPATCKVLVGAIAKATGEQP